MMAAPGSYATLPIFSGENYDYWSVKMKTLFLSLDLWDVVENGISSAAEGTSEGTFDLTRVKSDKQRDAKALFILQQAVSESIFPRLTRASSSQQAWKILQQEFQVLFCVENREAMTITRMDPILYEAAANGNISYVKHHSFGRPLEASLTPNKNTVLHIFITTLKNQSESTENNLKNQRESRENNFVRGIFHMCPSLLCQVNVKDETPLHVAARYGHANVIRVLIEYVGYEHGQNRGSGAEAVRKMLGMVNKVKDTALHEAVRNNHLEVIELLIKEVPDLSYSVNDAGETPLYIAVERKFEKSISEILSKCNSLAYDGPCGRTALHAAIFLSNTATIKEILDKIGGETTKKPDQEGWTPLHLVAYSNRLECTKLLLEHDSDVAYMKDKEGRTALHIAAHLGNNQVMESIIEMCPDCCELVDDRGWNALHFALDGCSPLWTAKVILKNTSLSNLFNEKDAEGNPPLHRHCLSSGRFLKNLIDCPRVDKRAFNKSNLNAYQVALTGEKSSNGETVRIVEKLRSYSRRVFIEEKLVKKIREDAWKDWKNKLMARTKEYVAKAAEAHLVVAALITTVTFAAAITMPGGFVGVGNDPHDYEGSAVLTRSGAFKWFILTDAISLVLSSCAVVTHLFIPLLLKYSKCEEIYDNFLRLAFGFILMAMGAMVLAFITGAYAVLEHSPDLAVTTSFIGLSFFGIVFWIYRFYRNQLLDIQIV